MEDENQPVVLDNGSGVLKAGFAGEDRPQVYFSSCVGRPKSSNTKLVLGGKLDGQDYFVGQKVTDHRGILKISYPISHGIVENWEDVEKLWSYVYSKECLSIKSEEHPLLLTEAPLNPHKNRVKAAELFFETFNVPAMFVAPQALLSLYASGRTTGVVVDCGDGVTHVVPCYEGMALPHAIRRVDLGGRDVTDRLQLLLRRGGCALQTSSEREVVRQIKEECCRLVIDSKEKDDKAEYQTYRLPDGEVINIGPEAHQAPELLFRPELIGSEEPGVHSCVHQALMLSDRDLRSVLSKQILLAGGSTLTRGFGDRLLHDLKKISPQGTKIVISAPPQRHLSTWVGGSILAALSTFNSMWTTRAEYQEHGARLLLDGSM